MSSTHETDVVREIRSDYKYGFSNPDDAKDYFFKSGRGISHEVVEAIAEHKNEPDWMRTFRHKSLDYFFARPMPSWGADLSGIKGLGPAKRAQFEAALELPAPVQHSQALSFAAQRLLRAFCHWLEAAQRAVLDYRLHVCHEDHPDSVLEFGLRQPCIDHDHLSQLLRTRLSELTLPAAAQSLRLEGGACVPLVAPNGDLFQRAAQTDDDAGRLLERLRGRLGEAAVRQAVLRADHRPEFAQDIRNTHADVAIDRAILPPRRLPAGTPAPAVRGSRRPCTGRAPCSGGSRPASSGGGTRGTRRGPSRRRPGRCRARSA